MISKKSIGETFLITTDNWFMAPDGRKYKAVFGTLKSINDSKKSLDIKTNARSTNWYIIIGNMVVAGCQVHYAIQTATVNLDDVHDCNYNASGISEFKRYSEIYNADE